MANGNSLATANKASMQVYIKQMEGEIKKALPSVMTPERFTRITLSALSNTPKLADCTPQSFLGAMMNAAQLGLEPNTPLGQAYLIPYGNSCQFILGYRGMLDLAHRSGVNVFAYTVYEKDTFEYQLGLNPDLKHIPAKGERGKPIGYYAVYKTDNGGYGFEYMTQAECEAHGKRYSKSYNNSPWQTNFEEMAKKTVIKKALKYAPLKSDFIKAIAADETVKTEISEDMYEVPNAIQTEAVVTSDEAADPQVNEATGEVVEEQVDLNSL